MRIIRCDASHALDWDRWVESSPRASFYHRFAWMDINKRCFGHESAYLAADDDGRFSGVLPLVRIKSQLFGNIACSLPFVNYGGPAGESDDVEALLLDAASRIADEWQVDYLEIRSRRHLGERFPTSPHKVSMTVRLDRDPAVLWNSYRAKAGPRQEIRRGYDHGFRAHFGGVELLDAFYEVLSESWRDLGTPIFQKAYLGALLAAFPERTRLCVIRSADGCPAAGALCADHRDGVEGLWLGVRQAYRRQMAGYVLYWELIKDACERGFSTFHLGRSSKDGGGQTFKHKWQADLQQLYWQYILRTRAEMPSLNVTNPRYQLAIKAWRRLPVRVTQVVGPLIARSIP
jgi:FemAB-related protein (PEP-CTERM system-associated)